MTNGNSASLASNICDRWIITGTVETTSPLMIRTGEPAAVVDKSIFYDDAERPKAPDNGGPSRDAEIYAVDMDVDNKPFIPATAFKALLRRICGELYPDEAAAIKRLFGSFPEQSSGTDLQVSQAGLAEFRNLFVDGSHSLSVRGRTEIDDGTRTAKDGQLWHQIVIDHGAKFSVRIHLDRVSQSEVAVLVGGLRAISPEIAALGSATRQGFGEIKWCTDNEKVRHLDAAAIDSWISECLPKAQQPPSVQEKKGWSGKAKITNDIKVPEASPNRRWTHIPLAISVNGFFLVSYAVDHSDGKNKDRANRRPVPRAAGKHGKPGSESVPYLPGSSLKGALRAQAERIYRTIHNKLEKWDNDKDIPDVIKELFGSSRQSGRLRCSDFLGSPARTVYHEMVAIDRFTGGAADGAKFSTEVFVNPTLCGTVSIDACEINFNELEAALLGKALSPQKRLALSSAAVALLALTLRDLDEGDIPLGFGTRKGYGMVDKVTSGSENVLTALAAALFSNAGDSLSGDDLLAKLDECLPALRGSPVSAPQAPAAVS